MTLKETNLLISIQNNEKFSNCIVRKSIKFSFHKERNFINTSKENFSLGMAK